MLYNYNVRQGQVFQPLQLNYHNVSPDLGKRKLYDHQTQFKVAVNVQQICLGHYYIIRVTTHLINCVCVQKKPAL